MTKKEIGRSKRKKEGRIRGMEQDAVHNLGRQNATIENTKAGSPSFLSGGPELPLKSQEVAKPAKVTNQRQTRVSEEAVRRAKGTGARGRNLHLGHEEPRGVECGDRAGVVCWDEGAVHAPVRAFRNPEYHCCSAAYIFMPRLPAIIQRSCDVPVHI